MKSLVPEYDDPLKLAAWLDANAAVFSRPAPPPLDGRAGGNGTPATVTDDEVNEFAARWGIDPRAYRPRQLAKNQEVEMAFGRKSTLTDVRALVVPSDPRTIIRKGTLGATTEAGEIVTLKSTASGTRRPRRRLSCLPELLSIPARIPNRWTCCCLARARCW
jgi:hypothetical protein